MKSVNVKCPFIESTFRCEIEAGTKPQDLRIDCFNEDCPAKYFEPLKCLNPTAPDDQKRFIGGHCKFLVNICEQCPDIRKCKKYGDAKIPCRQEIIDQLFRKPNVYTEPLKQESSQTTKTNDGT